MKNFIAIILFIAPHFIYAQMDSLTMKNGDLIVGEIKKLDKGIVEMKTEYSDVNFKIDWHGIQNMICNTKFAVTLSNGDRYFGSIHSSDKNEFSITTKDSADVSIDPKNIVYLKPVKDSFINKLSASIDVGYNYTKANSLSQLNTNIYLAYNSKKWIVSLKINSIRSVQNNVDPIVRDEGELTAGYFLPKDFYSTASISYLTNTEQSINLRAITSVGLGKFIVHTNKAYWGISSGISYLSESFNATTDENGMTTTKPSNLSTEWYLGTEINLFDIGDLSFNGTAKGYRELSSNERWRIDAGANLKYSLPHDFYIKTGYKMNYDTQPVEVGKELDYQYTLGFGWEL
ncbi:DUF481 domain-containing protein [Flammeovirga pacifica]|uniref:DUF481 domain-containing protein n=1 Tax=Flammeovirga pacifica TaxID=915059 RepID=A0A1S1YZ76_FLAPC|nr:DUF481 domain-containing protein [Flammeovirga pacifica]OHX66300.1 hypothetical protein NH26_08010 [Flammeovirga pacifica]